MSKIEFCALISVRNYLRFVANRAALVCAVPIRTSNVRMIVFISGIHSRSC